MQAGVSGPVVVSTVGRDRVQSYVFEGVAARAVDRARIRAVRPRAVFRGELVDCLPAAAGKPRQAVLVFEVDAGWVELVSAGASDW